MHILIFMREIFLATIYIYINWQTLGLPAHGEMCRFSGSWEMCGAFLCHITPLAYKFLASEVPRPKVIWQFGVRHTHVFCLSSTAKVCAGIWKVLRLGTLWSNHWMQTASDEKSRSCVDRAHIQIHDFKTMFYQDSCNGANLIHSLSESPTARRNTWSRAKTEAHLPAGPCLISILKLWSSLLWKTQSEEDLEVWV